MNKFPPHHAHWSRATISLVECKICGRTTTYEKYLTDNYCYQPLTFIDIVDETNRTSTFGVGGHKKGELTITVIGGLPHCTEFAPKTIEDADKLIKFLEEWKESKKI